MSLHTQTTGNVRDRLARIRLSTISVPLKQAVSDAKILSAH
jgi:hypothetical protein